MIGKPTHGKILEISKKKNQKNTKFNKIRINPKIILDQIDVQIIINPKVLLRKYTKVYLSPYIWGQPVSRSGHVQI